jgi:hypothetical protein
MYSQTQYILTWGLYATDRLVAEESSLRSIDYDKQLTQLAYLVDAGVPDMTRCGSLPQALSAPMLHGCRLNIYGPPRAPARTSSGGCAPSLVSV